MSNSLKIVLAQLNLTVGDFEGNLKKHIEAAETARDTHGADVIVFPELSLLGYPPDDLLYRQSFMDKAEESFKHFTSAINGIHCVVGHIEQFEKEQHNACSVVYNGEVLATYAKNSLPNYGVFDEKRYFKRGKEACVININNIPVGLVICEDIWVDKPIENAAALGAKLILIPNASPYEVDKHEKRLERLTTHANKHQIALCYCNYVCGQDSIIFDGGSMAVNSNGELAQHAGFFNETLLPLEATLQKNQTISINQKTFQLPSKIEQIYQALCLGVKDYVNKNGFQKVVIGSSGGIDSALTAAIATDALGAENITTVMLPSEYTAQMSLDDAASLAANLKIEHHIIPITEQVKAFNKGLAPFFDTAEPDITSQNIQARCRAILLMAFSNKFNKLLLSTSNRSEVAVGYSTLYGDMAGGFAVLKDIPKTLVYELSKYRNQLSMVIPERILTRAPSAELAPNQTDEEALAPYPILDQILDHYINQRRSPEDIIQLGFDKAVVRKVVRLIHINEYKRVQSPLGPRINNRAFGRDRRYPVTCGFKD